MKGAVLYALLSRGLTRESNSDMALEVNPVHLAARRAGVAPPVPLYAQGAHTRVSLLIT